MQSQNSSSANAHNGDFLLWVILMMLWGSFGISTLLNKLALNSINKGEDKTVFPNDIKNSILLVLGIWGAAYLVGMVIGFMGGRLPQRRLVWSAIVGFELMLFLRLIFLNAFPTVPLDAFQSVSSIFLLEGVPGRVSFLFLAMIFGAMFVALAVLTGHVIGREAIPRELSFDIDPRAMLTMLFLPVALWVGILGYLNLDDWEEVEKLQATSFGKFQLLHMEKFLKPEYHMLLLVGCTLLIALSPYSKSLMRTVFSVFIGALSYAMLVIIAKSIVVMFAPPTDFIDTLNLKYPDTWRFILIWGGTVFAASIASVGFMLVRSMGFLPYEDDLAPEETPA